MNSKNLKSICLLVLIMGTINIESLFGKNTQSAYQDCLESYKLEAKQDHLRKKLISLEQERQKTLLELENLVADCELDGNCDEVEGNIEYLLSKLVNTEESIKIRKQIRNSDEQIKRVKILKKHANYTPQFFEINEREMGSANKNQSAYQDYKQLRTITSKFPLLNDATAMAIEKNRYDIVESFYIIKATCEKAGNCETSLEFERSFSECASTALLIVDWENELLRLEEMKPVKEICAKYRK